MPRLALAAVLLPLLVLSRDPRPAQQRPHFAVSFPRERSAAPLDGLNYDGVRTAAVGRDGSLFIGEPLAHRVRFVAPNGIITTLAGQANQFGYTGDGGPATKAKLNTPTGITLGPDGNIYIAERFNDVIRRLAAPLPNRFNDAITIPSFVALRLPPHDWPW